MSEQSKETSDLARQIEKIVSEARDVRDRVKDAALGAVEQAGRGAEELGDVAREVVGAAARGAKDTAEAGEGTLRDVVDGLADAVEVTAQASKLAFEEAAGEGKAFVDEDVKRLDQDLRALGGQFVESVTSAAKQGGQLVEASLPRIKDHAERAFGRVRGSVEGALEAASKHPRELAGDTMRAGAEAGRQAAGTLFTVVGRMLGSAGDRLTRKGDEDAGDGPETA